jgi:hypothetical protein
MISPSRTREMGLTMAEWHDSNLGAVPVVTEEMISNHKIVPLQNRNAITSAITAGCCSVAGRCPDNTSLEVSAISRLARPAAYACWYKRCAMLRCACQVVPSPVKSFFVDVVSTKIW